MNTITETTAPPGANEAAIRKTPDTTERKQNREAFMLVLRECGYKGIADFVKRATLSFGMEKPSWTHAYWVVHGLASDGPLNCSSGGWTSRANEVATVLGLLPEDVFGIPKAMADTRAILADATRDGTVQPSLMDGFISSQPDTPETALLRQELIATAARAVEGLPERERFVLISLLGMNGLQVLSTDDVAATLGIDKSKTREIYERALRILSSPRTLPGLRAAAVDEPALQQPGFNWPAPNTPSDLPRHGRARGLRAAAG